MIPLFGSNLAALTLVILDMDGKENTTLDCDGTLPNVTLIDLTLAVTGVFVDIVSLS